MRYLFMLSFVAGLAIMPVWAFQTLVQPQLDAMKQTYANADSIASRAAGVR